MRIELRDLPEWAQKQLLRKIKLQQDGAKSSEQGGRQVAVPTSAFGGGTRSAGAASAFPTGANGGRGPSPTGTEKRSKYGAQKDYRGAIRFDSKKEARRYDELLIMLQTGQIEDLRLQQQFTLQESYMTPDGERVHAVRYVADFRYLLRWPDGSTELVVEDVKSRATRTAAYQIKKKLLQDRYGIAVREV